VTTVEFQLYIGFLILLKHNFLVTIYSDEKYIHVKGKSKGEVVPVPFFFKLSTTP
jgi:hypothetical protein